MLVLSGGRVLDPANGTDGIGDVYIDAAAGTVREVRLDDGDEISHIRNNVNLLREMARLGPQDRLEIERFDCTGKIVVPGLIDIHTHLFRFATPLGVPVDEYCLRRGVTTACDAGSSGATTFPGLRHFVAERCRTRVLAFLHIATHGLASAGMSGFGAGGELDSLNQVHEAAARSTIEANRDMIVGVKIRLSSDVAGPGGVNEKEALARARRVARACDVPLMTHHTFSGVKHEELGLRKGDIYTHALHGFPSTILEAVLREDGKGDGAESGGGSSASSSSSSSNSSISGFRIRDAVKAARARGVLYDVGHGAGSFNWSVAEACAQHAFWPDTISTDLHAESCEAPCYDMCTAMSKLLHVGMPLARVVAAATATPAKAIGWDDRIGKLSPGMVADVTVLEIQDCCGADGDGLDLEDCQCQLRRVKRLLRPVACWKGGVRVEGVVTDIAGSGEKSRSFPDTSFRVDGAARHRWHQLIVRDPNPPANVSSVLPVDVAVKGRAAAACCASEGDNAAAAAAVPPPAKKVRRR